MTDGNSVPAIDDIDRRIIKATEAGLALSPRPYHALADNLGLEADDVMDRMRRMLNSGVIRRIACVPNHYRLGYSANGMSVWDVPDNVISLAGAKIGALDFVSHSYHRPRHLPDWPFNLFAMVHGHDRGEIEEKVQTIAEILGDWDGGHRVLYSTRILKKTGFRLVA
ncbi:MAG: Lrp/AsnC family transcriptional regulator [Rhodospirillales bacterium]|nr:Lrp/AsnC family transcriptional regulator [Rhodospirillales bacterium]